MVFPASDASNFAMGHDLMVNGSHTMKAWLAPLEPAPMELRKKRLPRVVSDIVG